MEKGVERPEVRRAMVSGGERRAKGRPEVRRAMESGGKRRAMKNGGKRKMENGVERPRATKNGGKRKATKNGGERKATEVWDETMEGFDYTMPGFASGLVVCSTCSGFVMRKERPDRDPDEDVVEAVTEAEKMRDLMKAVLLHGPLQEIEPAEANKDQWQILRRRRWIMMETKRCPACSRSVLDMCPTCSRSQSEKPTGSMDKSPTLSLLEKPKLVVEDKTVVADPGSKAAGSKDLKKSSREEGSELMAVFPTSGSSSGLKKRQKAKVSGSEKLFPSSEMEGFGVHEVKMERFGAQEAKMLGCGNGKTKMVTMRLDKSCDILEALAPVKPRTYATNNSLIQIKFANSIAKYEVDCEFHEYVRRQFIIRGYAEYQLEVSDNEDE